MKENGKVNEIMKIKKIYNWLKENIVTISAVIGTFIFCILVVFGIFWLGELNENATTYVRFQYEIINMDAPRGATEEEVEYFNLYKEQAVILFEIDLSKVTKVSFFIVSIMFICLIAILSYIAIFRG